MINCKSRETTNEGIEMILEKEEGNIAMGWLETLHRERPKLLTATDYKTALAIWDQLTSDMPPLEWREKALS